LITAPRAGYAFACWSEVTEAIERGWNTISNGELLSRAETAGFELLLTTDERIQYQQNLKHRKIAIVVLGKTRVVDAVNAATPGSYTEVEIPFE